MTTPRVGARPLSRLLIAFLIVALLSFQTFLFLSHEAAIVVVVGPSSFSSSSSATIEKRRKRRGRGRDGGPKSAADGTTATFTPEEFLAGHREKYINLPIIDYSPADNAEEEDTLHLRDDEVRELMGRVVPPPSERLMHLAPIPPGHDAILGLASYPNGFATGWRRLVGSLRQTGYAGHVIMGVHPDIPPEERDYLDRMGVTYYAIEVSNCTPAILDGISDAGGKNAVRAKCSTGLEDMKLEWGRYEMARRWLIACASCTGWSMVIDTRDVFFQSDPFASFDNPLLATHDLLFVEEISSHTNTLLPDSPHRATNLGRSVRYTSHVEPCYGADAVGARMLVDRPMLCSGTVIGTRDGMHRFLSVLVDEFRANNGRGKPECRSPSTTDQWTMNHLYYRGRFGNVRSTRTLPWGSGPVLTVGTPCVDSSMREKRERTGRRDMMEFDENTGLILNPHEADGSACRVAPVVHQYDRCHGWIRRWFEEHPLLFGGGGGEEGGKTEDVTAVAWVSGKGERRTVGSKGR
jgi:hypothetical protein